MIREISCPICGPDQAHHLAREFPDGAVACSWAEEELSRAEVEERIDANALAWLEANPQFLDGLPIQHRAVRALFVDLVRGKPLDPHAARRVVLAVNANAPAPLPTLTVEALIDQAAGELLAERAA